MASEQSDDVELKDSADSTQIEEVIASTTYTNKAQSLVDIANNTFKELCKTLENEQSKLMELETRRKNLQEEMQRLKKEIDDEKESYRLNLTDSLTDNLSSEAEESVQEFIDRQRATIQKLSQDNESTETIDTMDSKLEEFIECNSLGPKDES